MLTKVRRVTEPSLSPESSAFGVLTRETGALCVPLRRVLKLSWSGNVGTLLLPPTQDDSKVLNLQGKDQKLVMKQEVFCGEVKQPKISQVLKIP